METRFANQDRALDSKIVFWGKGRQRPSTTVNEKHVLANQNCFLDLQIMFWTKNVLVFTTSKASIICHVNI